MKRKEPTEVAPGTAGESQTFEVMMERLESLVTRLEGGNLSLEDSIKSFEEGVGLVKRCTAVLAEAELRIQRLARDASSSPKVEALDATDQSPKAREDELPF